MSTTEQSPSVPPTTLPSPSRRGGLLTRLALALILVLVLGVASAGYYWVRFVAAPTAAALRAQLDLLSGERVTLQTGVVAAEQRLQKLESAQSAALSRVDELHVTTSGLARSLQSLAAQTGAKPLDWVLAECEYLILIATERLTLARDVETARAALLAADQRLRGVDHPAVSVLRERLASDLQALTAVPVPDIEGLALKFAAHIRRVDMLHTPAIAELDSAATHARQAPRVSDNWRGAVRAMWSDLLSLVEIKDGALPDAALFDPKLRYFLLQNLKLELSSARLAILQRDTANYRVAIEIVQQALARYFDAQDAAVKSLAAMLVEARAVELAPTLPVISASLDAVRAARAALGVVPVAPPPPQPLSQR
jgi:uroporphyrin-III C-methyltransferase